MIRHIRSARRSTRVVWLKQAHFDALARHLGLGTSYTTATASVVDIELSRHLDRITKRQKASITIGEDVTDGCLLGTWDNGSIYTALKNEATKQINSSEADRLIIPGQVMKSTFGYRIQGTLTGEFTGLFAGLTLEEISAGEEMKFGAAVGGIAGMGIRFLAGIFNAEGPETYEFTPAVRPDSYELHLTMCF